MQASLTFFLDLYQDDTWCVVCHNSSNWSNFWWEDWRCPVCWVKWLDNMPQDCCSYQLVEEQSLCVRSICWNTRCFTLGTCLSHQGVVFIAKYINMNSEIRVYTFSVSLETKGILEFDACFDRGLVPPDFALVTDPKRAVKNHGSSEKETDGRLRTQRDPMGGLKSSTSKSFLHKDFPEKWDERPILPWQNHQVLWLCETTDDWQAWDNPFTSRNWLDGPS